MKSWTIFFILLILSLYSHSANSAHRIIKDNKITRNEALRMISKTNSSIIVVNDEVLQQLNRFLGTPGGRKHMRECLNRMERHEPLISQQIHKMKLPQELLAIPVIESGYQNIHSPHGSGSGLWMFVKRTAKGYGLKINKKTDERLHVKKSTIAALKYLKANHRLFKDWSLSLLAYNVGENKIKKAIRHTGTKNVWKLIRKGHERDKGYLAKLIAVMIIIENPEVLQ